MISESNMCNALYREVIELVSRDEFAERVLAMRTSQYRIAWAMLGNDADSSDAMQNALLKAWASRHKLRDVKYFSTWMTRILINECKSVRRQRAKHIVVEDPHESCGQQEEETDISVQEAIDSLPEKLRLPVVMHYIEGYHLKEIAAILSLPISTVKNRMLRARRKLKIELAEEKEVRPYEA